MTFLRQIMSFVNKISLKNLILTISLLLTIKTFLITKKMMILILMTTKKLIIRARKIIIKMIELIKIMSIFNKETFKVSILIAILFVIVVIYAAIWCTFRPRLKNKKNLPWQKSLNFGKWNIIALILKTFRKSSPWKKSLISQETETLKKLFIFREMKLFSLPR